MAWTCRADRFERLGQDEGPGVGAYKLDPDRRQEPQYAPFGSCKARSSPGEDGSNERNVSPGPTSYDPKLPKAYDSGLPKRHIPFGTGSDRGTERVTEKDDAPGPGSYVVAHRPAKARACQTMGAPASEKKVLFKSASAPSIPQTHQSHGYEELGDGRLVRQAPRDGRRVLTGGPGDSVGPGHYQLPEGKSHQTTCRIMPMHRPREEKEDFTPGPGHYKSNGLGTQGVTSSFVSVTDQRPKVKKEARMPGPGQYDVSAVPRRDPRERHPDLQFFGSTVERFSERVKEDKAPGPGDYLTVARRRESAKSTWVKTDRFKEQASAKAPGPGDYNPPGFAEGPVGGTASLLGSTGCLAFGSMESRRFVSIKNDAPGPGSYLSAEGGAGANAKEAEFEEQQQSATASGRPRRVLVAAKPTRSQSAVFKSEVPVGMWTESAMKESALRPPVGAYAPPLARDTCTVMRQPPRGEGFGSVEKRDLFSSGPVRAPGPGRYNTMDITYGKQIGTFNRTIVEGVPRGGRPRGMGFDSQSKRFKPPVAKDVPGPGDYNTDRPWVSKTYNVHFGDVV